MNQAREKTLAITGASDVMRAQQAARNLARTASFDEVAVEEIVIAASELASNLVKHAGGGTLTFTPLDVAGRAGLQIQSRDKGPSISDVETAITDGYSTAGGLGRGLGAVHRLMDEMEITSLPGRGTQVTCCRWVRPKSSGVRSQRMLDFGAASRSYQRGAANGDAFVFKRWEQFALAGVIDGLGHGELAQHAALTARQYVESHCDQALVSIFRGAARSCRSTRGVVMALARFDLDKQQFSFASIGNIEARLLSSATSANFILRRGIIGGNAPEPVVTEHPWGAAAILALHSDGLRSRWGWSEFPGVNLESASVISQRLLRALDRGEDDATVVVLKGVAE